MICKLPPEFRSHVSDGRQVGCLSHAATKEWRRCRRGSSCGYTAWLRAPWSPGRAAWRSGSRPVTTSMKDHNRSRTWRLVISTGIP